jgi:hypothetical protein
LCTHTEHPAGTYQFHATHGHIHYQDITGIALYRVTNPLTGTIEDGPEPTTTQKQGFCLNEPRIIDFDKFRQDPPLASECMQPTGGSVQQARGWTDVYGWMLSGQFVEFSGKRDGYYVLRAKADPFNRLIETNETDNDSYSYIHVVDNEVQLLERGYGTGPFDPAKQVVR